MRIVLEQEKADRARVGQAECRQRLRDLDQGFEEEKKPFQKKPFNKDNRFENRSSNYQRKDDTRPASTEGRRPRRTDDK